MTLSQLITRARQKLTQAGNTTDMGDQTLTDVLNHGVDEVNLIVQCYKTTINVENVPAEDLTPQIYSLSSICPGFLSMAKSGVVWFNTSGQSMAPVPFPITRRWLDNNIPNWRNADVVAANPAWYWHEGDDLGFYPGSTQQSTHVNKDFAVHILVKSTPMTNGSNYPWTNGTSELTALRAADNAIVAYAVRELAPATKDMEARNYFDKVFKEECQKAAMQIKRQVDLTSAPTFYIRPDVSTGFLPR